MKDGKVNEDKTESRKFEMDESPDRKYILKLYVTGMTPRSIRAIENLRKICEEHFRGCYELDVIDIYQQPELAEKEQIIAAPTLIKKLPRPLKKFIGDLSNTEQILVGLDIKAGESRKRQP